MESVSRCSRDHGNTQRVTAAALKPNSSSAVDTKCRERGGAKSPIVSWSLKTLETTGESHGLVWLSFRLFAFGFIKISWSLPKHIMGRKRIKTDIFSFDMKLWFVCTIVNSKWSPGFPMVTLKIERYRNVNKLKCTY